MSAPPIETTQQSATSLYRIIDWQPSGRAATPAPVVPVPEAAVVQPNEVAEPIVLTPLAPATVAAPPVVAAVVLPKPATVAAPAKQAPAAQVVAPPEGWRCRCCTEPPHPGRDPQRPPGQPRADGMAPGLCCQ